MRDVILKLCVVFAALSVGVACPGTDLQTAAQTADGWAQRVCQLIAAVPLSSSSTLPANVTVNVQVTPSVAVAVVLSSVPDAGVQDAPPRPVGSAYSIPLPMADAPQEGATP
jgi:hypothetical protein